MRIGVVIPYHPGNVAEKEACVESVLRSFGICGIDVPTFYLFGGEMVGDGVTYSIERDREIVRLRDLGTKAALEAGEEFILQLDTDVRVPPDFAWWLTIALPRSALCFPVINHDTFSGGFKNERFEVESLDTLHPYYASECVGFSAELALRMLERGTIWRSPNEDYELCRSIHAAGAQLTSVPCRVVSY